MGRENAGRTRPLGAFETATLLHVIPRPRPLLHRVWTEPPRVARYAAAVLLAVAALGVTKLSTSALDGAQLLFALAAVSLSALYAGFAPGLVTAVLCGAGFNKLLVPTLQPSDVHRSLAFAGLAVLVASVGGALRSAHRKVHEARRESADRLAFTRRITGTIGEGVCATDSSGNITFMNPAAERMLGWSERELRGQPLRAHIHPHCTRATAAPASCPVLRTRNAVPCHDHEEELTRRDGSTLTVRCACWPMPEGGSVLALEDYTEHLRAERGEHLLAEVTRQLSESIDFDVTLKRVAEIASTYVGDWCLVVVIDRDGQPRCVAVETSNPAKREAARALLDRYPIDLSARHGIGKVLRTGQPELLPEISGSEFVEDGEAAGAVREALLRDIGLKSFMAVPLRARGQVLGVIDLAISETDRRFGPQDLALAEELARRCALALDNARLYREAQEATRVRENVLAVVSHDLKGPLGAIQLASRTIGKLAPADERGDALRRTGITIHRSATRMGRLIHDLLDFASIEAGRLAIFPEVEDIAHAIRDAVDTFRPTAQQKGLTLACDTEEALPPVRCDRDRVVQVLSNLLANAAQATSEGGRIAVSASAREEEIVISVTDTGTGIARDDLPHVFDRYWRGSASRYRGSGLGLAIAQGIVAAHGGRIWAESEAGVGRAVRVTLPLDGSGADASRAAASGER